MDGLEVSTEDADESNKCKFLDVEKIDQREQRQRVNTNTCEYEGESECTVDSRPRQTTFVSSTFSCS